MPSNRPVASAMPSPLRLALPLVLAALSGCAPYVEGNGVYAERVFDARDLPAFDRVGVDLPPDEAGEHVKASLFAAAAARQVVVSGDENVIQHVEVGVDGGRLRARIDLSSYRVVHPIQLRVQAPGLSAVDAAAQAEVAVQGAQGDAFAVTAGDRAVVTLGGGGGARLDATLGGGARLDASGYPVTAAEVEVSGGARATVWPAEPVTGTASGAGSMVLVKGGAACAVSVSDGATCGPL